MVWRDKRNQWGLREKPKVGVGEKPRVGSSHTGGVLRVALFGGAVRVDDTGLPRIVRLTAWRPLGGDASRSFACILLQQAVSSTSPNKLCRRNSVYSLLRADCADGQCQRKGPHMDLSQYTELLSFLV